ncbi:MAG: PQQ-binding-like beta-propeller repeat protein [Sedimentisphaerales bacterium]|nr:PQQ-binding-like beta-propeller repeat protein [Sedimentisphaerales bacterium]
MKKWIFAFLCVFLTFPCAAGTITVDDDGPADFNNIQAAINAANNGDTIIVADGTYIGSANRNIDFLGKAITVRSQKGTQNCIIDAQNAGRGFYFHNNEISNSVIDGFTIKNGSRSRGGGIYCQGSSPTIRSCRIIQNSTSTYGGGICSFTGSPLIANCEFDKNFASTHGGAIYFYQGSPVVNNCTFADNSEEGSPSGCVHCYGADVAMNNCILWDNVHNKIALVNTLAYPAILTISYSDVKYGASAVYVGTGCSCVWGSGNIDADPCYVHYDPSGDNDLHLKPASPCINAGDPNFTPQPDEIDIDGDYRIVYGRIDMGADEFAPDIGDIFLTSPKGGEVWVAGSTHHIKWNTDKTSATVAVSYSISNGADWVLIENAPDTGSFSWHLPEVDSNQCLVSVQRFLDSNDQSGIFTIRPGSPLGPPVASKWKSLGGSFDRSGLSQNFGPQVGCVKWKFQTGGPVSASPSVGKNGRIYLPCEDGKLYTIDGPRFWTYDANSPLLSSPSIGPDGTVYVGTENGTLYAIDVNGNLRWTQVADGFIYASPAVSADGKIFACSQDGTLYALAPDGSDLWSFETAGPGIVSGAIFASPAIGPDGTVYVAGLYDPNLYALDSNTGTVIWSRDFLDPCDPNGPKLRPFTSPVVAPDGTIYQTLLCNPKRLIDSHPWDYDYSPYWYDSKLYAINPDNGNVTWATNMTETATEHEDNLPWQPEPNYLFRKYYAPADLYEGVSVPQYPYTTTYVGRQFERYYRVNNACWSEPALGPDGTIYVSFDDQYLRAVDPNGSVKWVTSLGWVGGFMLTVGSDGIIYAAGDDGFLYVVDPDGKEIARFKGSGALSYPVITADDTLLVCDSDRIVWALGRDNNNCQGKSAALHRPEDLNADWTVDFIDFAAMADLWLDCTDTSIDPVTKIPYCSDPDNEIFPAGDINRDQFVNIADLAALADKWLIEE